MCYAHLGVDTAWGGAHAGRRLCLAPWRGVLRHAAARALPAHIHAVDARVATDVSVGGLRVRLQRGEASRAARRAFESAREKHAQQGAAGQHDVRCHGMGTEACVTYRSSLNGK